MSSSRFLLLLAQRARQYSVQRLGGACRALGVPVVVADPAACVVRVSPGRGDVLLDGRSLLGAFAVVAAFGPQAARPGAAVMRQLAGAGAAVVNAPEAMQAAWDRIACAQLLGRAGVAMPETVVVSRVDRARAAVDVAGEPPLVVHAHDEAPGSAGIAASDPAAVASLVETLAGLARQAVVQRAPSSVSARVRALVVDGAVVAAAQGASDDALEPVTVVPAAVEGEAVAAARALGLDWAGVDLVPTPKGALVLDVSPAPGFLGIEAATHVDVARPVIELALRRAGIRRRFRFA